MISVVCPVFNEEKYIEDLLDYLAKVDLLVEEIFFIDGGSTDNTVNLIRERASLNPKLKLLFNHNKYVSFALNLAIPECSCEFIVRLDAHCKYADDYFEQILKTFDKSRADIVGGPTRTAFRNVFQQAVGYAISTRLGVGGSRVHQINYEGETDSVTFGAWRKHLFDKIGLFDIQLRRNQDDEFHYRAKSLGKMVYQNPDIRLFYFPRDTISGLFRQYFEYGYYKPLVLKKIRTETKMRHLVPVMFVLYIFTFPVWYFISILALPFLIYLCVLIMRTIANSLPINSRIYLPVIYSMIHLGYGIGFLKGIMFPPSKIVTK